jgi:uncharacterized protein YjbI with pentapeptide repeats
MNDAPPHPATNDREDWRTYWAAQGMPWRTEPEIAEERQRILVERRTVQPNMNAGIYPFKGIEPRLTRADVEWLLATHESGERRGPVDLADGEQFAREGIDLRGADLRGLDLSALPLSRLWGGVSRREWLDVTAQQREAAAIHLDDCTLVGTWLEGAHLIGAHLQRAYLRDAHLAGSALVQAHLEGAILQRAYLNGRVVRGVDKRTGARRTHDTVRVLEPADIHLAFFDDATSLHRAVLGDRRLGGVRIADVRWNGVNLARTSWREVRFTHDEMIARHRFTSTGAAKGLTRRREEYQTAVRAYRQLAIVLRSQGQNEDADRFAYRAQALQKVVLRRQRQWLRWLGSAFLDLISGYGYKPLRSFVAYLLVVGIFAVAYYLLGNTVTPPLDPLSAAVFSITSFHGRGFAPGENVLLNNPLTVIAAVEAVIGLLIEITFIATFTQRFFAR